MRKMITILLCLVFIQITIFAFYLIVNSFEGIYPLVGEYYLTKNYIQQHPEDMKQLFKNVFNIINKCELNSELINLIDCRKIKEQWISKVFPNDGYFSNYSSTYFITLGRENTINKLFLDGKYKETKARSYKEQMVIELLKGKRKNLLGLRINEMLSLTYLNDLYSEAEIIVPVYDNHSFVPLGAIVRLYGD